MGDTASSASTVARALPLSSPLAPPGCSILCFGDSLTQGFSFASGGQPFVPYGSLLSERLAGSGVSVVTEGICGSTTRDMLGTLPPLLQAVGYSLVFILGGTNDLNFGHPKEEVLQNLSHGGGLMLHGSVLRTGARTAVITIPFLRSNVGQEKVDADRHWVNESLCQFAAGDPDRTLLVELAARIPQDAAHSGLWDPDGVHLSPSGYRAMGELICDLSPTERPPPGLELEGEGGKQAPRRAAPRRGAAKSPVAANDELGTLSISQIPASTLSSPTSNLGASTTRSTTSMVDFGADDLAREGVQVGPGEADGAPCEVAEWRISRLSEKLKGCMGKNLVSPAFEAAGLKDLRLMVVPDGKDVARGQKGTKRQKEAYAKKVSEGPLEGCLKFKVPECPEPGVVEYSLKVGGVTKGPFRHNFVDTSVNGCDDFGIDWLREVEPDNSLTVSVVIFRGPGHENAPREADAD
ncbi:unnamed protein product [Prorocentrum cordatum]|uniref:SGNH hydrolase-type esterase domain-containing protein n=1 Tax=Prorocentrum cordatum TaxID=2364126 RepID=A0ABN9RXU6_9DINO|nr:unnamed protein product [Polarella glacialis]